MSFDDRIFPDPFPPDCAIAWGDDRFGLWFDLDICSVIQRVRWIEPGTFWMGSPETDQNQYGNEIPRHQVTLTEGYWLADTACTQELWKAVVGDAPSFFRTDRDLPVENVSWDDITKKFLPDVQRLISDLTVALPTEAQWEYACRAGRESAYWFGDKITKKKANFEAYATVPVKAQSANGWGLYQMHGNLWEWCEGSLRKYTNISLENPSDGQNNSLRILRGGSWNDLADNARSAFRREILRDSRFPSYGFRFSLRPIKPSQGMRSGGAR